MQSVQAQQQPAGAELGLLGDLDQALVFEEADLDFLDELVDYPNDKGLQCLDSTGCGTASPRWDITPARSFETDLACSPQQLLLADQPRSHPLLQNAKQRTRELNRRHQKRFREKQKAPEALSPSIHALLQTPWTAWGALLTCDLLQDQEEACQLVAKMTYPQLAVIRQGYVTKVAKLLLVSGHDVDPQAGLQLGQLLQEFCTLHTLRARVAPRECGRIFTWSAPSGQADKVQRTPDWFALLRILQLTEDQKRAILSHRRMYISHMARLSELRKQLLQRLHSESAVELSNGALEARQTCEDQILRQLENCTVEANRQYFHYVGSVGHDAMTVWQACVSVVHAFPQSPDVLAIGNALAEEEGDASAELLHAAAVSSSEPATSGETWSQASALVKMDDLMQDCVASVRSGVCESEVTANQVFG
ncbi:MAG: hypothetical protein FRX49_11217 [Trebouxia sp. A1-2]|nr:MAG: hypothetical protein FRX49_11217 [Trebouxia sp. A1-2]